MLPNEDQLDRLFADEAADQAEAVDLEEFGSYGPVVACAVVMAFIVLAIVQMLLFSLGAPSWVGRALMLLYVTLPQGAVLVKDLSAAAGKPVGVRLRSLAEVTAEGVVAAPGTCIDELDVTISNYAQPMPELLRCDPARVVEESLHSHLLKSNCPVTGQPDWGTLVVQYRGLALDHASLLAYLVSFRQHADFHEQCVERIFLDLQRLLKPEHLTVYARYVRRGGLDINPYRSSGPISPDNQRLVRQ